MCAGWPTKAKARITALQIDDFLVWATLGVVLGGRLGYVLFYKPSYYFADPLEILQLWHGGMSFHGGALGVIAALILLSAASRRSRSWCSAIWSAAPQPIGQFFGRVANFINGELWGRVTDDSVPWAMVFPGGGPEPRHPSQLYEAGLEGLALFVILHLLWRQESIRNRPGFLAGAYLIGYGIARIIAEFFRQPDDFMGFLWAGATMGQLLSVPLIVVGSLFILRAKKKAA